MDKIELVQRIGCEVCECCLLERDCGVEPLKCGRIEDAVTLLDRFLGGLSMDYRKALEQYYDYLGREKPVHKMITNHLLCFADWLTESASQQAVPADGDSGG